MRRIIVRMVSDFDIQQLKTYADHPDSEIDLGGLFQGKVKTGSAGVIMLFFGTIIFCTLIAKGSSELLKIGHEGMGSRENIYIK